MDQAIQFYGIGVGPGDPGLLPLASVEAMKLSDQIYLPRSKVSDSSVALRCISGLDLPEEKFREVEFKMETDRSEIQSTYEDLAQKILEEIHRGKIISYLTLGDTLTYSTFAYLLKEIQKIAPDIKKRVIPGITSYNATSAALQWPLCEGKERVLICPCPDDQERLRNDILSHDRIVLMKVYQRLPMVLELLKELEIIDHCAMASYIGMDKEQLVPDLNQLDPSLNPGYLSTVLVKKTP